VWTTQGRRRRSTHHRQEGRLDRPYRLGRVPSCPDRPACHHDRDRPCLRVRGPSYPDRPTCLHGLVRPFFHVPNRLARSRFRCRLGGFLDRVLPCSCPSPGLYPFLHHGCCRCRYRSCDYPIPRPRSRWYLGGWAFGRRHHPCLPQGTPTWKCGISAPIPNIRPTQREEGTYPLIVGQESWLFEFQRQRTSPSRRSTNLNTMSIGDERLRRKKREEGMYHAVEQSK
jgi:hypothetical protein